MQKVSKRIVALAMALILLASYSMSTLGLSSGDESEATVVAPTSLSTQPQNEIPVLDQVSTVFDFEKRDDELNLNPIDGFAGVSSTTMEVTTEEIHSGVSAMKIIPPSAAGGFNAEYLLSTETIGSVYEVWMYDDMDKEKDVITHLTGNTTSGSWAGEMYFGWREDGNAYSAFTSTRRSDNNRCERRNNDSHNS